MLRVERGGDLDLGQLLARGAELVHVALAASAYWAGAVAPQALEAALGRSGRPVPPGDAPPVRGLPASVISATWHLPAAIAAAACPTWARYEEPPVSVESTYRQRRPR